MNYIAAIQHATIGYGIRRLNWDMKVLLLLQRHHLHFVNDDGTTGERAALTYDDMTAENWETVPRTDMV